MRSFLTISFLLIATLAFSQNTILLKSERNADNSYQITYTKDLPGTYCIYLNFSSYENTMKPERKFLVNDYSGILTTLKPIINSKSVSFSYSYTYRRGIPNPKIDSTFVYLLPFKNNKKVGVQFLNNLEAKYFDKDEPKNWKSFLFLSNQPDTVCAVRKGLVVKVIDNFTIDTSYVYSYSSKRNMIMIEHKDGTFAKYQGFNGKNIFVKEGDTVLPNQPLGTLIQYDKKGNYQLRFSIDYLTENPNEDSKSTKISSYEYINPLFQTTEGLVKLSKQKKYECVITKDVILKELSKKEIKKMANQKM